MHLAPSSTHILADKSLAVNAACKVVLTEALINDNIFVKSNTRSLYRKINDCLMLAVVTRYAVGVGYIPDNGFDAMEALS